MNPARATGRRAGVDADTGHDLAHRVAKAHGKHWLARVFQNIDDLFRRRFQIDVGAVREQVVIRAGADGFHQAFAEFLLDEAHDGANALQRKAAIAQLADYSDFGEIVGRIEAAVAFMSGNDNAPFIPPLELARRDAGETYDFTGCEPLLHFPHLGLGSINTP